MSNSEIIDDGHQDVVVYHHTPQPTETDNAYMNMSGHGNSDTYVDMNIPGNINGPLKEPTYEDISPTYKQGASNGSISGSAKDSEQNGSTSDLEKTEKPKWTRVQLLTVIGMAFANFADAACFSLLGPFFPEEAQKKGANKTVMGLIFGAFELTIFLTSPIFGSLITRIGSKFMFIAGVMICGACAVMFGFLDQCPDGVTYIVMCFCVRTTEAVGASMYVTASFAIVANMFPDNVATVFGSLEMFSGIGMMVGPVMGGALYQIGGFKLPFIVAGSIVIVVGSATTWIIPPQDDAPRHSEKTFLSLIKIPSVMCGAITVVVCAASLGFLDPTLSIHLEQFKLTPVLVGLMFLIGPAVYGLTAPLMGFLSDKKHLTKPMMVVGLLAGTACFALLGPSPIFHIEKSYLWLCVISLVMLGLGVSSAMLPVFSDVLIEVTKYHGFDDNFETYGLISGLFNSCFSLGAFSGPTLGGYLLDKYNFDWASTIFAGMQLAVTVLILCYYFVFYCIQGGHSTKTEESSKDERQALLSGNQQEDPEDRLINKSTVEA